MPVLILAIYLLKMLHSTYSLDGMFGGRTAINVKTTLFRDSDTAKTCWSTEDVELLIARKLMQDLVPKKLPTDFDQLATYIKTVISIVKNKSPPESATKLTLAAYDALGGYLKAVALPVLNEAYYAGNVNYCTAAEIHGLFGKIMAYLKTDGGGWAGPIDMRKVPTKVRALTIVICNVSEACGTLEMRQSQPPPPINEVFPPKELSVISIPYLDDNMYPNAIAVPLKGNSLFSLMSNCSTNLLPKFYVLAMRCLASDAFSKKEILTFNHNFYDWIIATVVPHVHETERWYPGFGGVMRIIETMNQKGLASSDSVRPDVSPSQNTLPPIQDLDKNSKPWHVGSITWIIALMVLLLFISCCGCYCIIRQCFKPPPMNEEVPNEGLTKTLVSIYCGVKDTIVGGKGDVKQPYDTVSKSGGPDDESSEAGDECKGPYTTSTSSEEGETTEAGTSAD